MLHVVPQPARLQHAADADPETEERVRAAIVTGPLATPEQTELGAFARSEHLVNARLRYATEIAKGCQV
jgi:hypothetical protein